MIHIPGRLNPLADALSRLVATPEIPTSASSSAPTPLATTQQQASVLAVTAAPRDSLSPLQVVDAIRALPHSTTEGGALVLAAPPPRDLFLQLLALAHSHPLSAHFGVERTLARLRSIRWPGQREQIRDFIRSCPVCQLVKTPPSAAHTQLSTPARAPLSDVFLDFVGPLPRSSRGSRYILVIVDRFTRWCELEPTRNPDAESALRAFFEGWVCRHGVPETIHTDGGSHFANHAFEEMVRRLSLRHHIGIPYHSQSQGAVERQNETVLRAIRSLLMDGDKETRKSDGDWEELLAPIRFTMNTSPSRAIGISPWEALFGQPPRLPLHVSPPFDTPLADLDMPDAVALARRWTRRFPQVVQDVQNAEEKAFRAAQAEYERRHPRRGRPFSPGDYVLVRSSRLSPVRHPQTKLSPPWTGPFLVLECPAPVSAKVVSLANDEEEEVVHFSDLVPFFARHDGSIVSEQL